MQSPRLRNANGNVARQVANWLGAKRYAARYVFGRWGRGDVNRHSKASTVTQLTFRGRPWQLPCAQKPSMGTSGLIIGHCSLGFSSSCHKHRTRVTPLRFYREREVIESPPKLRYRRLLLTLSPHYFFSLVKSIAKREYAWPRPIFTCTN